MSFAVVSRRSVVLLVLLASVVQLALLRPVRWSIALFVYMQTLSGLWNVQFPSLRPSWHAYLEWEMALNPELFRSNMTEIPEIAAEDYTWATFLKVSENMRRVIVVRNLFNGTKPLQEWGSDEWIDKHNDYKFESVQDYGKANKYVGEYTVEESSDLRQFIQDIRAGEFRSNNGMDELYSRFPYLFDELNWDRFLEGHHKCRSSAFFVSGSGAGSVQHNENHPNLAMQIQGSKTWNFVHPEYSLFLSPSVASPTSQGSGFIVHSPKHIVDKVPEYSVRVNAGDVLFNAPWVWHRVVSEVDPVTNMVMMSSCRFTGAGSAVAQSPILEFYRTIGQIDWIHPSLPRAVSWIPFFRIGQEVLRELAGTQPEWSTELDCFSSKRKACKIHQAHMLGETL